MIVLAKLCLCYSSSFAFSYPKLSARVSYLRAAIANSQLQLFFYRIFSVITPMLREIFSPSSNNFTEEHCWGRKRHIHSLVVEILYHHSNQQGELCARPWCAEEVILTSEARGQHFCMAININILMSFLLSSLCQYFH